MVANGGSSRCSYAVRRDSATTASRKRTPSNYRDCVRSRNGGCASESVATEEVARGGGTGLPHQTRRKRGTVAKLEKRNLMRPIDVPAEGLLCKVVELRESESGFYHYDLLLKEGKTDWVIGLQKQSFNINQLIDLLGDDTDKWPKKEIRVVRGRWNDQDVLRFFPAAR